MIPKCLHYNIFMNSCHEFLSCKCPCFGRVLLPFQDWGPCCLWVSIEMSPGLCLLPSLASPSHEWTLPWPIFTAFSYPGVCRGRGGSRAAPAAWTLLARKPHLVAASPPRCGPRGTGGPVPGGWCRAAARWRA